MITKVCDSENMMEMSSFAGLLILSHLPSTEFVEC